MLKLRKVFSIQDGAFHVVVKLKGFQLFQKSRSACSFCRVLQPNKVRVNSLILLAMSNVCATRFHIIQRNAGRELFSKGRIRNGSRRSFSCYAPQITPNASLIVHPRSSLPLVACITQSDAPQRSDEWFALRKNKLTTSTFSTALGFWKGKRRFELWHEKVYAPEKKVSEDVKTSAMEWGVLNEAAAIDRFKSITGHEVSTLGFAIHPEQRFDWIGASPDGLLGCSPEGGVLEVKCPFNKGKPELALPWSTVPFYYMPQVQGQLEVMDREWADLYCWTPNASTIFRVCRDRSYWELIQGMLWEFWWENVVPAREAVLLGMEQDADSYKPESTHKLTGLTIVKSLKLATDSKLLCREIAGHVEFFRL